MLQRCCCVQLMQVQKTTAARQLFSHFHFISSPLQTSLFSAQDVQIRFTSYAGEGSVVYRAVKSGFERGYSLP